MIETAIGGVLLIPYIYLLAWTASKAYFNVKARYQQQLMQQLAGEKDHG